MSEKIYGYSGKIAHINLTDKTVQMEHLSADTLRKWVGGASLGAKYMLELIPVGCNWNDPQNVIAILGGPLGGAPIAGTGMLSLVTVGSMTNFAATTQANGFFTAYMASNDLTGILISGCAEDWTYLEIKDGQIAFRDASKLVGLDIFETEDALRATESKQVCVFGIGQAGENMVRFAGLLGDKGHIASKGAGAVFGSKKLKAIMAVRSDMMPTFYDLPLLRECGQKLFGVSKDAPRAKWGTAGGLENIHNLGALPVKNYTTSVWPPYEGLTGQYYRTNFEHKPKACWNCALHARYMIISEGKYKGFMGKEPEYECISGVGSSVDIRDPATVAVLGDMVDRYGMDVNEIGWVLGWVMECYEKGIFTKDDLEGLEADWGNVDTVSELIRKIAYREGVGNLLADGVKIASETVGRDSEKLGVYTMKGATPRGHDHRGRWPELLDTCLSNTSSLESCGTPILKAVAGVEPIKNRFDPIEVATYNAKLNGYNIFLDSVPICRFVAEDMQYTVDCINAATGWDMTIDEVMQVGKRAVNCYRLFSLKHGIRPEMEMPSPRYCSTPVDGPAEGIVIGGEVFLEMRRVFWQNMGWDTELGRPLKETLEKFSLDEYIPILEQTSTKQ